MLAPRLGRCTHTILTLTFHSTLGVLCRPSFELLLLLLFALSSDLVLLVLLLATELFAALFGDLAPLLFELPVPSLLNCAQLLIPDSTGLLFLSLTLESLLLNNSFAMKAHLFLSAYFLVETDLLFSFPPEPFFLEPLLF